MITLNQDARDGHPVGAGLVPARGPARAGVFTTGGDKPRPYVNALARFKSQGQIIKVDLRARLPGNCRWPWSGGRHSACRPRLGDNTTLSSTLHTRKEPDDVGRPESCSSAWKMGSNASPSTARSAATRWTMDRAARRRLPRGGRGRIARHHFDRRGRSLLRGRRPGGHRGRRHRQLRRHRVAPRAHQPDNPRHALHAQTRHRPRARRGRGSGATSRSPAT